MKYLGLLLLGMLLGALVYREVDLWRKPAHATASDCAELCASAPAASPLNGPARPPSPAAPAAGAVRESSTLPIPIAETAQTKQADIVATASTSGLLIPVQGKTAAELTDTFTDARSQGRSHDAIDIMAPAGTPVLAVVDGQIEKLFDSQRGGLTVYQFEPTGKYAYYYAHLQRYADGLAEKQILRRGQVIGYVGSTGNANPEAPHLHFAIFLLGPERRWWEGTAINPYPLLVRDQP